MRSTSTPQPRRLHVSIKPSDLPSPVKQSAPHFGVGDAAVATNPSGDAGVEFGGFTGFSPEECVGPAETNLKPLS